MFETNMGDAAGAAAVLLFFLVVCIAAGFIRNRQPIAFSMVDALVALALLPNALALWSTFVFAATSFLIPGRLVYLAGPAIVFAVALRLICRRTSNLLPSGLPPSKGSTIPSAWVIVGLLPVTIAIVIQALRIRFDHDISLYLMEASSLSLAMREGFTTPLGWLDFADPFVSHPHSLAFSHYLALGFLASDTPGFGSDLAPRILIGLSRASFLASVAVLPMMLMRSGAVAGLLALAFLVFDVSWRYQLGAAARDVFYLAPFFVMTTLLLRAQPARIGVVSAIALAVSVWGSLTGHSLGVVFVAPVVFITGLFKLLGFRKKSFRIVELWIAATGIVLVGTHLVKRYFLARDSNLGFAYPYYEADPALMEYWKNSRFVASTGLSDYFSQIYLNHTAILAAVVALIAFVTLYASSFARADRAAPAQTVDIRFVVQMVALLVITNVAILLFPIELDGISLTAAFSSNLRYSLGLKTLLYLIAGMCVVILVLFAWSRFTFLRRAFADRAMLAARLGVATVLIAILVGGIESVNHAYKRVGSQGAYQQEEACNFAGERGAKTILVGRDSMIYRCSLQARYILTDQGARILSARTDEEFDAAMRSEAIDAVAFTPAGIRRRWIDTHLYDYLQRNWVRMQPNDRNIVFISPELNRWNAD